MDKKTMEKALKAAFDGSPEAQAALKAWQDKKEELARVRAMAFEYSDKSVDMTEKIELAQGEIDEFSVKSTSADSFEKMKKRRAQIREMKAEREDLRKYAEHLEETARKLYAECLDLKRQLDETVHGAVLNPVYLQVNGVFEAGIAQAEMMLNAWSESWAAFRRDIGGTATPNMKAVSRTVRLCIHGG